MDITCVLQSRLLNIAYVKTYPLKTKNIKTADVPEKIKVNGESWINFCTKKVVFSTEAKLCKKGKNISVKWDNKTIKQAKPRMPSIGFTLLFIGIFHHASMHGSAFTKGLINTQAVIQPRTLPYHLSSCIESVNRIASR